MELALALPVLALGMLLVVQAGVVVAGYVATVHAAREAARAVAVDARPGAAASAVAATGRSDCQVAVDRPAEPGATLQVTVACRVPTDMAIVGPLLPEITARARAAMRVER